MMPSRSPSHPIRRVSTDPETVRAKDLVKTYTFKLEEQAHNPEDVDRLQSSVVSRWMRREYIDRLERMYKPSAYSDPQTLERHRRELREAQQDFVKSLPSHQREAISSQPFTREQVLKVVENAIEKSEKSRFPGTIGKAKQFFHKICGTIDAHSKPLKMLPGASLYCSIFYGAMLTIIHASVNYQAILKSVPEAIAEINGALSSIDKQVWLYPTENIKMLVQKLYTEIFRFLIEVMKWYSSKKCRIIGAFNEGLQDSHKGFLARVLQTAEDIGREAQCGNFAEVRHLRLSVEELKARHEMTAEVLVQERNEFRRICEEMCERQRRADAERRKELEIQKPELLEEAFSKFLKHWNRDVDTITDQELIAEPATRLLLNDAEVHLARDGSVEGSSPSDTARSTNDPATSMSPEDRSDAVPLLDQSVLMEWRKHFEGFFEDSKVLLSEWDSTSVFFAEAEALVGLQSWLGNQDSCCRYIQYPASMSVSDSPSTLLAARLVSTLREQGLPVLSYFCATLADDEPGREPQQEDAVVKMTYALIWQLLNHLPAELTPEDATLFDVGRLGMLRPNVESFDAALALLDDLLRRSRLALLFLVIDGLHWIEDLPEDPDELSPQQQRVKQFVGILRGHQERCRVEGGSGETFKVLFTTSGSSSTLMEALEENEVIFVWRRVGGRRPGRPSQGMQPFGWWS